VFGYADFSYPVIGGAVFGPAAVTYYAALIFSSRKINLPHALRAIFLSLFAVATAAIMLIVNFL